VREYVIDHLSADQLRQLTVIGEAIIAKVGESPN
jgi:hypothetical protein